MEFIANREVGIQTVERARIAAKGLQDAVRLAFLTLVLDIVSVRLKMLFTRVYGLRETFQKL